MKVIIDISPLKSVHKTRGIGMYTRRLVEALRSVDKKNQYILTTKKEHIKNADIIHYPYFDLFAHTLPIRKKTTTIVTIHDVTPLVFPDYFPVGVRGRIMQTLQRIALSSAAAVITDSRHSQRDIERYLSVDPKKIHVIYLAADDQFYPRHSHEKTRVRKRYHLPGEYLLYVGDVNPNKNLERLIEGFSLISRKFDSLTLVLVGRVFEDRTLPQVRRLRETITHYGLDERVRILSKVPLDPIDDLAGIYSAAKAYIHPSLYEGFGLPLLEAFACGTPVVCSFVSSIPEVAGEAAIYVEPQDPRSIADGMIKVMNLNPSQIQALVKKGKRQAGRFSWGTTARETISVYRKVIEAGS